MKQEVKISIRKFEKKDIIKKVEWINNPENNKFLHYDIPITIDGTKKWFESHKGDQSRFDAVIEVDHVPVGTIGLLNIDKKNSKAEYYIAMGETTYKGKGIAKEASNQLINYGFKILGINKIYLFTEIENINAQKLFERIGFVKEGVLRQDIFSHGELVDRIVYSIISEDWKL